MVIWMAYPSAAMAVTPVAWAEMPASCKIGSNAGPSQELVVSSPWDLRMTMFSSAT